VADSTNVVSDNLISSGHVLRRMRTATFAIIKCGYSDFDEIWHADANFDSEEGHVTQNQNFTSPRGRTDGRHLEILFSGYISAPYCPLNAKFGVMKQNHT